MIFAAVRARPVAARLVPGLLMGMAGLAWQPVGAQAPSPQVETIVTAQPDIIDLEFHQDRRQFVWTDAIGRLWLGNVNESDCLFEPRNGKGTLVDRDALTIAQTLTIPINGPEWIHTAEGPKIVYTKLLPDSAPTRGNARLALATELPGGRWVTDYLSPELARNGPYASKDTDDAHPRISYAAANGTRMWREIDDPSTEEAIPMAQNGQRSVRWIEGERALIYAAPVGGQNQVHRYDIDSKQVTQLTFDDGEKDLKSVPWMWRAPEFGGEHLFFTIADYRELRVYRQLPDGNGGLAWSVIYSAQLPPWLKIMSPEPFVYQGRSYIYFVSAVGADSYASMVWLSNIDRDAPWTVKLVDNTVKRQRSDPEVFFCSDGAYLYFNRADQSTVPARQEGVWRVFTGLGPIR